VLWRLPCCSRPPRPAHSRPQLFECGKSWIFTLYGGGGASDQIVENAEDSTISGTERFTTKTVGVGSSFASAESNYFYYHNGGALTMTLDTNVTPSIAEPNAAVGTLALTLYSPGAVVHSASTRKHKPKHRSTVVASCSLAINAPNYYQEE